MSLQCKLKEKCGEADVSDQISLLAEQDVYNGVIASCIQLLAQDLESAGCEAPLSAMTKMPWAQIEAVGDQSAYVTALYTHMKQAVPLVRSAGEKLKLTFHIMLDAAVVVGAAFFRC